MDNASVAELEQHALALRGRLRVITDVIRALLAEDLPKFVERELKKTFVSNPDFASGVSDDKLREFKQALTTRATQTASSVIDALTDEGLWECPEIPEDSRSPISANPLLWAQVSRIATVVDELQSEFDFPGAGEATVYKPPTWFIGRRYLPALSEKYWSVLRELTETESRTVQIKKEASRSELAARWDEA